MVINKLYNVVTSYNNTVQITLKTINNFDYSNHIIKTWLY